MASSINRIKDPMAQFKLAENDAKFLSDPIKNRRYARDANVALLPKATAKQVMNARLIDQMIKPLIDKAISRGKEAKDKVYKQGT